MGYKISLEARDGQGRFDTYVAETSGPARAAVVVVQEIFGVNAGIRKQCDDWAAKGYLALAPDIFWRAERWVQLDPDNAADMDKAMSLLGDYSLDKSVSDIEVVIAKAREMVKGKVGVVGFCLGGTLAYLAATRTDVDAAAGYYGGFIHQFLGEADEIKQPLLLHFATADAHIGPDVQKAVHDALDGKPLVTIHDYEGKDHAFARAFGKARDEEAANLADGRTEAFFAENLG